LVDQFTPQAEAFAAVVGQHSLGSKRMGEATLDDRMVASRSVWRDLHDNDSLAVFDCPASAQEAAGVAVAHLSRDIGGVDSAVLRGLFVARSFRRTDVIAFSSSNPDRRTAPFRHSVPAQPLSHNR
jgi:hypothetical protein